MPEQTEIVDKQDYVLATYIGEFSLGGAKKIVDQIFQFIPANSYRSVLLDCRQLTGPLSVMDRFWLAIHGQKLIGRVTRIALVRPAFRADADRFAETAAVNRGINMRLFSDFDEAVRWAKS